MNKHTKLHSALLLLAAASTSQAREVFLQEDFSDGAIPIGWTTADESGQNALWTYCADPNKGQANGCPPLWDDALNGQGPFTASSADNGFMTLDSDIYGNLPNNHISQLTAATLDLTDAPSVFVEFEGFIGAYTVVPLDNAVLQVSNDGGVQWTNFNPYPNLVTGAPNPPTVRWSFNPTKTVFDISSVAAGESNVMIRWSWTGTFEFFWSIDDLVVANLPDLIFADGLETISPP